MAQGIDVRAVLLRAEQKALKQLNWFREAVNSPSYAEKLEHYENVFAHAHACRVLWEAGQR